MGEGFKRGKGNAPCIICLFGSTDHLIWRVLYSIAAQHFSEILCTADYVFWSAEPNAVVVIRKLGLCGCKLVDLKSDLIALQKARLGSVSRFSSFLDDFQALCNMLSSVNAASNSFIYQIT